MSKWVETVSSKIIEELLEKDLFNDYKYVKSKKAFVKKTHEIKLSLTLKFSSIYIEKDVQLLVQPIWEIRYNYLHKWLEHFYQGSDIKTYRNRATYVQFYSDVKIKNKEHEKGIIVKLDKYEEFLNEVTRLTNELKIGFNRIIQYEKLNVFYEKEVKKILSNEFNVLGISYFERLAAVKICRPELLNDYIAALKIYFKKNAEKGEVNALDYYPIFEKIIDYLHNNEFRVTN